MKTVKLLLVANGQKKGNNKFFNMTQKDDSTFETHYGRVGYEGTRDILSMDQWDSKYREKTNPKKKGGPYKDVTSLFADVVTDTGDKFDISNKKVYDFIIQLQSFAKSTVTMNYTVTSEQVTMKQIDEAQSILDRLTTKKDLDEINELFIELFHVIPRKMLKVKDNLLIDRKGLNEKISAEQDLLDVMKGQVNVSSTQKGKKTTSLDDFGLSMEEIKESEIVSIKKMMAEEKNRFKRAFKVVNKKTQEQFNQMLSKFSNKETQQLWHGSRNENWWSIMQQGLLIRPTNAVQNGKMFGYGIYGANKARKSIGYTSIHNLNHSWVHGSSKTAFLAIYEFLLGNMYETNRHEYWMSSLTDKKLREKGDYQSLYCKGGYDLRNDEFIVYNQNQCTIKYIVEIGD